MTQLIAPVLMGTLIGSTSSDLQSIVNWGNTCHISANASKTNLLHFTAHREPSLPFIIIADVKR